AAPHALARPAAVPGRTPRPVPVPPRRGQPRRRGRRRAGSAPPAAVGRGPTPGRCPQPASIRGTASPRARRSARAPRPALPPAHGWSRPGALTLPPAVAARSLGRRPAPFAPPVLPASGRERLSPLAVARSDGGTLAG